MQAIWSLELVWSNTAFVNEAQYLSAGHAILAHWLHGTPVPGYSGYFSGAPVLYPPAGALADTLGGLAGARILSLLFMLGATALLWSLTGKLFGGRAAGCAAALFAVLGPTLRLGAFATFDAMALLLLAAAAWCVVSARDHDDSTLLLLAGTVLLVLANATKYSTVLCDPAVVALAGLTTARHRGAKAGVARAGYVAAGTTGLISVLLAIGGSGYAAGVLATTVTHTGGSPARLALGDSWKWVGMICVIAAAGAIVAVWRNRSEALILAVFAATGFLAPLNEVRIHATTATLSQYVDFGAWFAAAAAGYAIAGLATVGRRKAVHLAVTAVLLAVAVVPLAVSGREQASGIYRQWPNSARLITALQTLTRQHPGRYLAEDDSVPAYYLRATVAPSRWSGTWSFHYRPPGAGQTLTGPAAYRAAIEPALLLADHRQLQRHRPDRRRDRLRHGDHRRLPGRRGRAVDRRPVHDLGLRTAVDPGKPWSRLSGHRTGGRHRRYGLNLPNPPSDEEKARYADRNLALIIRTSLASFGALLISQSRFVFLNPVFTWIFLPFVLFTHRLLRHLAVRERRHPRSSTWTAHRALVDGWRPARYPSLDIFLPICGEPLAVLANTWTHVAQLVAAYPGQAIAYVLDDGPTRASRQLAGTFGFTWTSRARTAAG